MVDFVKVILAKKEAVYGVDAAPTAAANRILTRDFSATPIATDLLERNLDLPSFGSSAAASTNARQTVQFETELSGSGAAGTAPAWMELLEGCGMLPPALVADTSATQKFAPVGATLSALTLHHWIGDQRRRARGARGTFGLNFTAGAYPFANFQFTGMLPPPPRFDKSVPETGGLVRWRQPLEVNDDNTTFELDGYAAVLQSLVLTANANPTISNLVGERTVERGNHAMQFVATLRAPDVTVKNYLASLDTGAAVDLNLTHGADDGDIVEVSSANAQITAIAEQELNGKLMWQVTGRLNVADGQDDLIIVAR